MRQKQKVRKMTSNLKIPKRNEHDDTEAVNAYIKMLEHPLKTTVEEIRRTILEADPRITEGIKWNSSSFYCYGWFATINLKARNGVQVVLHHGAKIRDDSTLSLTIDDPSQLLTWPSQDRAIVTFVSADSFQSNRSAFKKVIKQWADYQAQLATPK
jgi:hypothetical protein